MPVIAFGACTDLPTLVKWALHRLCESAVNKDADLVTAGRAHARACASAVAPALALALAPALLLLLCFPFSAQTRTCSFLSHDPPEFHARIQGLYMPHLRWQSFDRQQ